MRLSALVAELPIALRPERTGEDVDVRGVQQDSRLVAPGDLFVARRGHASDGTRFVAQAIERGAVAVLCERDSAPVVDVPIVLVHDCAEAIGFVSSAVYGHPSRALRMVGVTGTNGKTTTTQLVRSLLDGLAGRPSCATIGTVGTSFADRTIPATHTTPEGDALARLLAGLRGEGAREVAMEVSSIALSLGRVNGVSFEVASFGNLTQDHLDFHGDMNAYGLAKQKLFFEMNPRGSVVNIGDAYGASFAGRLTGTRLLVSPEPVKNADIFVRSKAVRGVHTEVVVATPSGDLCGDFPFAGRHNLENLVVSLGIVQLLGHDLRKVEPLLASLVGAPGRLQLVSLPGEVPVFVDYAHTPDALVRVLEALRPIVEPRGRLFCVFGCGGDRDAGKRAPMGEAVGRGADIALVTNDNPRTEDPQEIARPITAALATLGIPQISSADLPRAESGYVQILDREAAIGAAIAAARPGDVVLIAGKGHEDYQILGTTKTAFDDRNVARLALDGLTRNA